MIKAAGGWLLLDAIGSILTYHGRSDGFGKPQDWRHDHWMRIVRALIALYMIIFG